jgi:hypothetical protein
MRENFYDRPFIIGMILCFSLIIPSNAFSQTTKGYFHTKLEECRVGKLLGLLSCKEKIVYAPKYYYDKVYDDELPDLIVFINKVQKNPNIGSEKNSKAREPFINIALVQKGKKWANLFGERFIYVTVFVAESQSDYPSVLDPIGKYVPVEREVRERTLKEEVITKEIYKETPRLSVWFSSLKKRRSSGDFALLSIAEGIAGAFVKSQKEAKEGEEPEKADIPLNMKEVGCHKNIRLTYGMAKIAIAENSINRVQIGGLSDVRPIATFGNYSGSFFTSSISLMLTPLDSETAKKENKSQNLVEPFIHCHIYLKRPKLPTPRSQANQKDVKTTPTILETISVSLVVGTELSKDVFDDIFIGGSIGHFLGPLGIVFGRNFRLESDSPKRKGHWAIGLTYIF